MYFVPGPLTDDRLMLPVVDFPFVFDLAKIGPVVLVCLLKSGPIFELVPAPIMELRHGQESQA